MDNNTLDNPYRLVPGSPTPAAFAGREQALARLHQRLTDPTHAGALLFTGGAGAGKTAFLRHLIHALDETVIAVYISLDESVAVDEMEWLLTLARAATGAALDRGLPPGRLAHVEPPLSDTRAWFAGTFLPEILAVIRPHRRLIFLLDDAHCLLDAVGSGRLPQDTFTFLRRLLDDILQLDIVLTLGLSYESETAQMQPLVGPHSVFRLTHLQLHETAALLREPVALLYSVSETAAAAVHRATGGWPVLVRMYGEALFERWHRQPDANAVTPDDVKTLTPVVAARAEALFRETWQAREPDEQAVLAAISHLYYADPLATPDAASISAWLVETDFPLDSTAVNAALRSLEYEEIIGIGPNGVAISAGLMHTWLLEHARLPSGGGGRETGATVRRPAWPLAAAAVALVVVAILVLIAVGSAPGPETRLEAAPTVTLASAQ